MFESTVTLLKEFEFHKTISAMEPIKTRGLVRVNSGSINETLSDTEYKMLNQFMNSASQVFDHEAREREVIELNKILSEQVIDLNLKLKEASIVLKDNQSAMLDDMMDCLRVGLYRQAIVTAWMLGYDILRVWVFDNKARLDAFNAWHANGTKNNTAILEYEDFFKLNEAYFLDACMKSADALNVFTSKIHRSLIYLLDERNAFAHSNFRQCSNSKAEAYVERLFDILCEQPFKTNRS